MSELLIDREGATVRLGNASATVMRTMRERDEAGRTPWLWVLSWDNGKGWHVAELSELIYTHDSDPGRVLVTLSNFLDAWDEAQRYPHSENRDLFTSDCEPFLAYVGELSMIACELDENLNRELDSLEG